MKTLFLTIILICITHSSLSQKSIVPELEYESEFKAQDLPFTVGSTMILQQFCTDKSPKNLVNHAIRFNNYFIEDLRFTAVIYFKDTLITKAAFYFTGKDVSKALSALKLPTDQFLSIGKKATYYTRKTKNTFIHCWINKKKIYFTEVYTQESIVE